jgi:hypothetical protein
MATDAMNAGWLKPFEEIRKALVGDSVWGQVLGSPGSELPSFGIHLAVFIEPFLGYVLDGSKTVESRFSVNRCAPFGKVKPGDAILLKEAGGPVVGIARVPLVWSYHLDEPSWRIIRTQFADALRVQDLEFWEQKRDAFYATLMSIDRVRSFKPIGWDKKDRRGWVVMRRVWQLSLFRGDDDL